MRYFTFVKIPSNKLTAKMLSDNQCNKKKNFLQFCMVLLTGMYLIVNKNNNCLFKKFLKVQKKKGIL